MTDDLVKRLRAVGGLRHDGATRWYVNPDGLEAADRIEALETALREILQVGSATENLALWVAQDIASHALAGEKKE